ncbi:GrpB family protein [Kribbella solani]|uniref:GrpB family protein n=1 Tax=Kribbella solani TaxID=236067 RepID=UPI0029A21B26|nr:GrpB family protein [Kribbella solani]MDX2972399.1 GrpB family protein [Kribbella solani]
MNSPAEVVEYDPRWPLWFTEIHTRLMPYLTELPHRVEHVGSTSVPGLAAKPIIDLDVVVPSADVVPAAIERLAAAGYRHEGDQGIAGREAFALPPDAVHYHHLYVVVDGNKAHRDHVLLRDHLRTNAADRERYAERKRELAYLLRTDRPAYVDAKGAWVEELIASALSWKCIKAGGSPTAGDSGRTGA